MTERYIEATGSREQSIHVDSTVLVLASRGLVTEKLGENWWETAETWLYERRRRHGGLGRRASLSFTDRWIIHRIIASHRSGKSHFPIFSLFRSLRKLFAPEGTSEMFRGGNGGNSYKRIIENEIIKLNNRASLTTVVHNVHNFDCAESCARTQMPSVIAFHSQKASPRVSEFKFEIRAKTQSAVQAAQSVCTPLYLR